MKLEKVLDLLEQNEVTAMIQGDKQMIELARVCIKEVKKRIGKKPINDCVEDETHSGNRFERQIKVCECGNIYLQKYQKYCNECGQKIDWSEEE